MAKIEITIPDQHLSRVTDAFTGSYGYQATLVADPVTGRPLLPPIPNPETRTQFTKRKISQYVREVVQSHEREKARSEVVQPADLPIT